MGGKVASHRHDAEIVRLWSELRRLVAERWREQMSELRIGKPRTRRACEAIAKGVEKAWADPEKRERMAKQRKVKRTREWRKNMSDSQKASASRRRAKVLANAWSQVSAGAD
jgi:hypothetical protein